MPGKSPDAAISPGQLGREGCVLRPRSSLPVPYDTYPKSVLPNRVEQLSKQPQHGVRASEFSVQANRCLVLGDLAFSGRLKPPEEYPPAICR